MKITKLVPKIIYRVGAFSGLEEILKELFPVGSGYLVYIIDSVHQRTGVRAKLPKKEKDLIIDVDVSEHEPRTSQIDEIRDKILTEKKGEMPIVIVGIGGGSTMDIAKAVSVVLTNKGSVTDYQGWDLVKEKSLPKVGIPTLSGTGAEATRTAVLTSPDKKMGINSEQSMFDAIVMDPELLKTVDRNQEFFSAMDCFIHCVESLGGSFIDDLGRSFASVAKKMTVDFFLKEKNYGELMVASYLGGCSIANSEVGVCHALSYGISLVLGYRHGVANCVVFNQLEEFYGPDVKIFKNIVRKHRIELPKNITKGITEEMLNKMIEMTYKMDRPLTSALGKDWKNILTREKITNLYEKM
ncbi:MAG: iron-containing alcohol dehydrogenase family protein [Candidatus Staskawiczbacteria bacterium]|jgi:3-deoxy-alpha-D-manno-octulosonate 8-oxidase